MQRAFLLPFPIMNNPQQKYAFQNIYIYICIFVCVCVQVKVCYTVLQLVGINFAEIVLFL